MRKMCRDPDPVRKAGRILNIMLTLKKGIIMQKKRIYSMWAKTLVVLLLLASAVTAGISGSWIMLGFDQGMDLREIMEPASYERSGSVKNYLQQEGQEILENIGDRSQFCLDGTTYDEMATIDIRDVAAGVSKQDKNPETEYTLKSLEEFYNSDGYDKLRYLAYNAVSHVWSPEDYGYDTAEEDTSVSETDATESVTVDPVQDQTDVLGSEAPVLGTESVDLETGADSEGEPEYITFDVKCYASEYNVLYNNGIAIEQEYITNVSGGTIAEFVQKDPETESLEDSYKDLLDAGEQVHAYLSAREAGTNARLYVRNSDTGAVYTNVSDWKTLPLSEVKESYQNLYGDDDGGVYYYVDEKISVKDTVTETAPIENDEYMAAMGDYLLEAARDNLGEGNYQLLIGLDTNYPLRDSTSYRDMQLYQWYQDHNLFGPVNVVYLFFTALAAAAVLLIILGCQTGRMPEDDKVHPALMDRFPIEILMVMDICLWVLVVVIVGTTFSYYGWSDGENIYYYMSNEYVRSTVGGTAAAVLTAALLAWELKRYGRRIKEKDLGGSIIRSVAGGIRRAFSSMYQARKESQKLVITYTGFLALHFIFLLIAGAAGANYMGFLAFCIVVALILFDIYVMTRLALMTRGRDEIRKGMKEISAGNLDYQIDTAHMSGDNREMAEELNRVRDGLKQAIEVEMKSERLKTDLITNVSHDIKTPLTSIINYVDILKRENIQDEKIAGYIAILDRKALRLKQLTEDLVEASKISSGNITLEMQNINLKQLIKQTNGEFEEKFAAKNLELICSLPESEMIISADGRRMFRVIENLYNNAAKYSMPNSRVYVSGELKKGKVIFSMKNMSENPLNFKAEELLERFVRGDVSRSTEGSGLGLEIAKNLTVMQGGTLDLYLDGDLFKVTVTFDAV